MHRPVRTLLVAAAALLLTAAAGATPATAHPSGGLAGLPAVQPVMPCAGVTGVTVKGLTITSATVVTANTPAPYCEVRGTIAPANTVVVRLPVNGWTQRYVQTGCGGLCGNANINYGQSAGCPVIADGTVASATTDMGHQGQNDGSWAAGNPQAQIDFSYRGVHETAVAAKALIKAFYHRAPAYSYFTGCSDGGREALMEAQRYPDDFDGIAAGAPASNMAVQNTFHHAWNVLANKDANGAFILLSGKLPLVHAAVLAACDGIDGLTDGLIDDPRLCRFDPASLHCTPAQDPATCLSPAEATVVRKLHDGATDARGNRLEPAVAHPWGSELEWTLFVPAAQGQTVASENFALSFLRYLADPNHPNPAYQLTDLRFTVESFWRTVLPSSTYMAALDPDLGAFQRGGGRLILWHGWNDQHISAQNTLVYWDTVRRTMGQRSVERFARLYLFPGMAHCGGGAGPNTFDVLTPLMSWVERGNAPGRIVAGNATRTRPVFPYPAVARYDGSGSIDDAANFVPYTPPHEVRNDAGWVGERLFSHGYQTWPRAVDGKLLVERG
ncbi:tannase/feruloyl esterase family alpha/beta hydrolase [Dactylosporangium sp. AC04546]|uniref:tannase/feruloyl esterase family alpha/beta hydrolase n=1 Tax=Dactylosporangium sp. AC04546 TaxID=2862460 RepID=UPI0027E06A8A|nr:tannase/feruloyl esterase family alpha/beta hydrolase [Dactylosporangium sp. AC04546]WVK78745.1 tannase/feruloyl esterase family alpha/beta hydrolase [Dactylosporangium sp. AC04546]